MMDKACVFSTLLFFLSNILHIAFFAQYRNAQEDFTYEKWKDLDVETLQKQWDWRMENRSIVMAAGVLNALAWFAFAIPILHVVWIQSLKGQRQLSLHVAVALLAIGGATTELLSRLLYIGSSNTMEWLVKDFNLDNWLGGDDDDFVGWKAMEVTYMAVSGSLLWIDAVEWLFLAAIFTMLFVSIQGQKTGRVFSMTWVGFGVVVGLMCLLDFSAEVLRFKSWRTFSEVAMLTSALNRLILFPVWLLWLGRQLPRAEATLLEASSSPTPSTMQLTEVSKSTAEEESHALS